MFVESQIKVLSEFNAVTVIWCEDNQMAIFDLRNKYIPEEVITSVCSGKYYSISISLQFTAISLSTYIQELTSIFFMYFQFFLSIRNNELNIELFCFY